MPALLDPLATTAIRTVLNGVDRLAESYHREASAGVAELAGLVQVFLDAWPEKWREILAAPASYLPLREDWIEAVRTLEGSIDRALDQARKATALAGQPVEHVERLRAALAPLRRFHEKVFPRWTSVESLEDLAAEELAPPLGTLRAIAAQHPFPQAWYDETSVRARRITVLTGGLPWFASPEPWSHDHVRHR